MAPIDGRRDVRDYSRVIAESTKLFALFTHVAFLGVRRHRQVNTSELAAPSLIQTKNDFFDSLCNRVDASLPIAANVVLSLLDDVAVPASTHHPARRLYRFYRNNSVFLFDQGLKPD